MIYAGFDVGNGYFKGLAKDPNLDDKAVGIDLPSATAIITNSTDVRITEPRSIAREMQDIYNVMEVSVESPLVDNGNARMYVGKRAIRSGKSVQEFNLKEGRRSKSETELSAVLTLSALAGKGLTDYYKANGKLPGKDDTISIEAKLAVSLPIAEYKLKREEVARKYTAKPHLVRIHNFENTIRVDIHVTAVDVAPEGASAQFAIASKGEKFMMALIRNMEANGIRIPSHITARDIMSAGGIIGIDIGEGTVNFPIYQDLKFNADTSSTMSKGYGSVMDEVVSRLAEMGRPFDSRKKLVEWMMEVKDKPLKKSQYDEVCAIRAKEIDIFTDELMHRFSTVLEVNGAFAEVVYVYGGGANPVQESLYPKLIKAIYRTFGEKAFMPVLYLDSRYSRCLNRDGLYLLASAGADVGNLAGG